MIEGSFLREAKNRFLCEVRMNDGTKEECYVPSSCRLSNFADFCGCRVLLREVISRQARTKYALYAIKYHRRFILIDLKEANNIIGESLKKRQFSFLGKRSRIKRECFIGNYKSDLYIEDTNSICEIKSVLSLEKEQRLPMIYSERALQQLREMKELLEKGFHVYYFFVALNPCTECLILEDDGSDFVKLLMDNIFKGMICKAYSIKVEKQTAVLNKEIKIVLPSGNK